MICFLVSCIHISFIKRSQERRSYSGVKYQDMYKCNRYIWHTCKCIYIRFSENITDYETCQPVVMNKSNNAVRLASYIDHNQSVHENFSLICIGFSGCSVHKDRYIQAQLYPPSENECVSPKIVLINILHRILFT